MQSFFVPQSFIAFGRGILKQLHGSPIATGSGMSKQFPGYPISTGSGMLKQQSGSPIGFGKGMLKQFPGSPIATGRGILKQQFGSPIGFGIGISHPIGLNTSSTLGFRQILCLRGSFLNSLQSSSESEEQLDSDSDEQLYSDSEEQLSSLPKQDFFNLANSSSKSKPSLLSEVHSFLHLSFKPLLAQLPFSQSSTSSCALSCAVLHSHSTGPFIQSSTCCLTQSSTSVLALT